MDKNLNITMSSDNNYADITYVAMNTIINENGWAETITFNIVDAGISEHKKKIMYEIRKKSDNIKLNFFPFEEFLPQINKVVKKCEPPLPLITYARLFVASVVEGNQTLYVDSDTICCRSLEALWDYEWKDEKVIAGVQDTVFIDAKRKIGLDRDDYYINAGIMLINLERWRKYSFTLKSTEFIKEHNGIVLYSDQGTINGTFHKNIDILPLRYNVMTVPYMLSRRSILKYFGMDSYYSSDEIKKAKKNPVFIHFVRFTTSRPWEEKCRHPQKLLYTKVWKNSDIGSLKLQPYNISKVMKILYFLLENTPFEFYDFVKSIIELLSKIKHKLKK